MLRAIAAGFPERLRSIFSQKVAHMQVKNNPLVSICCLTYNHEKYIRDAIDGFLKQKTNFAFEILIHDDASTDGTPAIIKDYQEKYPDIIFPILQKENQFSKGVRISWEFQYSRARGTYIALCEGDDYWTDPDKLQTQVDFLEQHPDYSLCSGGFESYNQITGEREIFNKSRTGADDQGFSFGLEEMLKEWLTKTLTVTFRADCLSEYLRIPYKFCRDVHLYYHLMKKGRGYYFSRNFGVYRVHGGGIHSMVSQQRLVNSEYIIYKEIYGHNRDEFTRIKYLRSILHLFNYDLYFVYQENTFSRRIGLFLSALGLARRADEIRLVMGSFSKKKWFVRRNGALAY